MPKRRREALGEMNERRLMDLALIEDGDAGLALKEACIEILRCHARIDELLAVKASGIAARCADELRMISAECTQILDKTNSRILPLLGDREVKCQRSTTRN